MTTVPPVLLPTLKYSCPVLTTWPAESSTAVPLLPVDRAPEEGSDRMRYLSASPSASVPSKGEIACQEPHARSTANDTLLATGALFACAREGAEKASEKSREAENRSSLADLGTKGKFKKAKNSMVS
ncbi:hypothetical protein [Rufibacter roseolus]|uniref:hypothetical protein n=1 Tax=Rufibacter roseolus TaxID=2817375 RepID=UPI001B30AA3F|nr:hypothetical protein [Rufibacter roseolus]